MFDGHNINAYSDRSQMSYLWKKEKVNLSYYLIREAFTDSIFKYLGMHLMFQSTCLLQEKQTKMMHSNKVRKYNLHKDIDHYAVFNKQI